MNITWGTRMAGIWLRGATGAEEAAEDWPLESVSAVEVVAADVDVEPSLMSDLDTFGIEYFDPVIQFHLYL